MVLSVAACIIAIVALGQVHERSGIQAGVVAGTLRSGWHAIEDETHKPLNIESVYVEEGYIVVKFGFEATAINTFVATPDEMFARDGVIVGSSVSSKEARIQLSRITNDGVVNLDAANINGKWRNIWIYGLFETRSRQQDNTNQENMPD